MQNSARRNRGFSLIEVLIASVIFGIGLMGLASLQTAALQTNTGAWQRSAASLLSHDLFERLRANPGASLAASDAQSYVSPEEGWSVATLDMLATSSTEELCQNLTPCTPADLRLHDLWFWGTRPHMLAQLPAARARIQRTPVGDGYLYSVTLTWTDDGVSLAATNQQQITHQALILPAVLASRGTTT